MFYLNNHHCRYHHGSHCSDGTRCHRIDDADICTSHYPHGWYIPVAHSHHGSPDTYRANYCSGIPRIHGTAGPDIYADVHPDVYRYSIVADGANDAHFWSGIPRIHGTADPDVCTDIYRYSIVADGAHFWNDLSCIYACADPDVCTGNQHPGWGCSVVANSPHAANSSGAGHRFPMAGGNGADYLMD